MVPVGQPPGAEHGEPSLIGSVGLHAVGINRSRALMSGTDRSPPPPCCASSLPQPATANPAQIAAMMQVLRMARSVLQKAGHQSVLASPVAVDFHLRSVSHCAVRWKSAKRVILPTAPRKTMAT